MLASGAGGVLYDWDVRATWVAAPVVLLGAFAIAALFVRDPEKAEA